MGEKWKGIEDMVLSPHLRAPFPHSTDPQPQTPRPQFIVILSPPPRSTVAARQIDGERKNWLGKDCANILLLPLPSSWAASFMELLCNELKDNGQIGVL